MTSTDGRRSSGKGPSKSKRQLEKEDPSKLPCPKPQGRLRVETDSSSQQTSEKAPAILNSSGRHLSHQHFQHKQKDPPMRNSFVRDDHQFCGSEPGLTLKIAPEPLRADKSSPPGGEDLLKVSKHGPSPRFMSGEQFTSNYHDEVSHFNPNEESEKTAEKIGCFGRYKAASPKSTRPVAYMNPAEMENWAKEINKEEAAAVRMQKLTGNFVRDEAESSSVGSPAKSMSTLIASKPTPTKEVPGLLSGADWIKLRDEHARKRRRRRILQVAGGLLALLCLVTIFLIVMLFVKELNFIDYGPTDDNEADDAKIRPEVVSEVIHSPPPLPSPPSPPISPGPPPPPIPSPPPCPPIPPIRSPPPNAPSPPPAKPPKSPPPAPQMPICIQKDWSQVFPIPFERWPDGYTYANQLGARDRKNRHHHRGLLQTAEIANATNFSSPPPGPSLPPPSPAPPSPPPAPSLPPPSPPLPSPPSPPPPSPPRPSLPPNPTPPPPSPPPGLPKPPNLPGVPPRFPYTPFSPRSPRPPYPPSDIPPPSPPPTESPVLTPSPPSPSSPPSQTDLPNIPSNPSWRETLQSNSGWMGDWIEVEKDVEKIDAVVEALRHAWSGYAEHAMGYDELRPLTKGGKNNFGGLGLTVLDSLDVLWLTGLDQEYYQAKNWVEQHLTFALNSYVSVFEITIRALGGLVAIYDLTGDTVYRDLAIDLGDRLLPAFSTSTGIPFSEVNLLTGQGMYSSSSGAGTGAVLSEVGTLQLEFNALTRISGDPTYSKVAAQAMLTLEDVQPAPTDGLYPVTFDPLQLYWNVDHFISFGARGDSFYEYLLKVVVQFQQSLNMQPLLERWKLSMQSMINDLVAVSPLWVYLREKLRARYVDKMDHLACFVPGMLALGLPFLNPGDVDEALEHAEDLAETCREMYARTATGLAPESVLFNRFQIGGMGTLDHPQNFLRPETVESFFLLYRRTGNPKYREWGWEIFQAFEKHSRVDTGGYAGLKNVNVDPPTQDDTMQSFFLAETLKYLFLLFSDSNMLPLDVWVLNTEGHPLQIHCID